jgi:hypothetical protein
MPIRYFSLGDLEPFEFQYPTGSPKVSTFASDSLSLDLSSLPPADQSKFWEFYRMIIKDVSESAEEMLPEILLKAAMQLTLMLPNFPAIYLGPAAMVTGALAWDLLMGVMEEVSDIDVAPQNCGFVSGLTGIALDSEGFIPLDFVNTLLEPIQDANHAWASNLNLTPAETVIVDTMAQGELEPGILTEITTSTTKKEILRRLGLFVLAFAYRYVTGNTSLVLVRNV